MALFDWKAEYSVSVQQFDAEHQRLFSLLNQLNEAMANRRGRQAVLPVLEELMNYTRSHFSAEEKAMRAAHYLGLKAHIQQHREIASRVDQYYAEYQADPTSIPIDVLYFLRDWIEKHILRSDRLYAESLQQAGIQ